MNDQVAERRYGRPPLTIRAFGVFYPAFALAAFANNVSMLSGFQSELTSALGSPASPWLGLSGFTFRLLGRLLLAWFIVRRASNVARWLVFLFALPWAWQMISGVPALIEGDTDWLPWLGVVTLQIVALSVLLAPSARLWIARKGRTLANDLEDFS